MASCSNIIKYLTGANAAAARLKSLYLGAGWRSGGVTSQSTKRKCLAKLAAANGVWLNISKEGKASAAKYGLLGGYSAAGRLQYLANIRRRTIGSENARSAALAWRNGLLPQLAEKLALLWRKPAIRRLEEAWLCGWRLAVSYVTISFAVGVAGSKAEAVTM
jgi:hypothetical protein